MSGAWNRAPGKTAAEANLDGAPHGFKVTGDAAWASDSRDYAMFSDEGNRLVAELVAEARKRTATTPEHEVVAWLDREKAYLAAAGACEVYDTMVRETISYALDEAWTEAYGHRHGEPA